MAIIQAKRSDSSGSFERKQPVRLSRKGVYGGLFARYSLPKTFTWEGKDKEQFAVAFIVTHDQAYRPLPQFTEAFRMVTNTLYYDEKTGKKSMLVDFLYAMYNGRKSYVEIVENDVYDCDDFISKPASLFIEPATKADKNGIFGNRIVGFEPADRELLTAIKPLFKEAQIGKTESGLSYLTHPVGQFVDDQRQAAPPLHVNPADDEDDFFAGLA